MSAQIGQSYNMFQQPYREKYFTGDALLEWPLKIAEFFSISEYMVAQFELN